MLRIGKEEAWLVVFQQLSGSVRPSVQIIVQYCSLLVLPKSKTEVKGQLGSGCDLYFHHCSTRTAESYKASPVVLAGRELPALALAHTTCAEGCAGEKLLKIHIKM